MREGPTPHIGFGAAPGQSARVREGHARECAGVSYRRSVRAREGAPPRAGRRGALSSVSPRARGSAYRVVDTNSPARVSPRARGSAAALVHHDYAALGQSARARERRVQAYLRDDLRRSVRAREGAPARAGRRVSRRTVSPRARGSADRGLPAFIHRRGQSARARERPDLLNASRASLGSVRAREGAPRIRSTGRTQAPVSPRARGSAYMTHFSITPMPGQSARARERRELPPTASSGQRSVRAREGAPAALSRLC